MTEIPILGSEEQIVFYLFIVVGLTIAMILLSSVLVYAFWDCWPLERIGLSGCLASVVPAPLHFLPMLLGILLGVMLARRFIRKK